MDGIGFDLFQSDLIQYIVNEFISKFNALYSSSALVVNNFAFVKKHICDFRFLDYSDFYDSKFERQFKTGLRGAVVWLQLTISGS
jgi:hypothetical protein